MSCSEKEWLDSQLKLKSICPGVDEKVLYFIKDFLYHEDANNADVISSLFNTGYCWYFAHNLKLAFGRGRVCLTAPYSHFVWVDDNSVSYDIDGIFCEEYACLIDEEDLGTALEDFMHVPGKDNFITPAGLQILMLKHGYALNGSVYKSLEELKRIDDNDTVLRNMCSVFYLSVVKLLPSAWKDFDFDLLLSVVIDALSVL